MIDRYVIAVPESRYLMSTATLEQLTREDVPVEETWDLTSYYPDDAAFDAALASIPVLVEKAASHQGKLGESAAGLRQALDDSMEARQVISRAASYAHLRKDENVADPARSAAFERAITAAIQASQALAFFQPELLQIPEERYNEFLKSPELEPYRHSLEDAARQRPYVRSVEVEQVLAQSAEIARTASDAFGSLNDADLDFGKIENEDGELIQLTRSRYQLLMESKNRDVRMRAYDALMSAYENHKNTTGSLLAGSIRNDNFYASVRGYESARASALLDDNIPESVYDSLVEAVSSSTATIERYYKLRSRLLGIDDLALYDLYVPLSPEPERRFSIHEAVDTVLGSLSALGETYTNDLRGLIGKRTVDWHETAGKNSGAYSSGSYGANPVILMNWNGSTDHVFTLAHEAGHQMHTFYSQGNNPFHYAGYSIFLAEVASTVNETLLTWDLLAKTPEENPRERFAILNQFADTISGTLVRQTMFADFEHRAHEAAAQGQPLTPETLSEIYGGRTELYRPGVLNDERSKLEWSRVPHFYRAYYVFQYATGISAALAIASKIRDEGPEARKNYLGMLKAGSSDYPIEVLKRGGADLTTPEPVLSAMRIFDETIAEMEKLADGAGFTVEAE
jgi:oligoendopeptidase F